MRLFYRPIASWACFGALFQGLWAAPDLAFPVNSQVPPVAYASQPYHFAFSDSTFQSDKPVVSYALTNAPTWLSLNPDSRNFEGKPASGDVGASTFQLQASDGTDETSSEVTLVVLERPNIGLGKPILPDLTAAGPVSAPATLLLRPVSPFTITFASDVFSGTSPSTNYYAISANSSPLPPWVQFDSQRVRFFGTTPPLISPREQQQVYGISLVASDVPGFAEATVTFEIAIAFKSLAFSQPIATIVVTSGRDFESPPFRESLKLDDQQITDGQIASVSADLPPWMHLDTGRIVLSGTVPENFQTARVTISATDTHGNTASVAVEFTTTGSEDNETTSQETVSANAVIGEDFNYTFPRSIIEDADQVTTDLSSTSSWLTFSPESYTLYGKVPNDVQPQDLDIVFIATASGTSTSIQLTLHLMREQATPSSTIVSATAPTSSKIAEPAPTEMTRGGDTADASRVRPKHIIFVVLVSVLPALLVLLCILLLIWCLRRRSKRTSIKDNESGEEQSEGPPSGQNVDIRDTVDLPPVAESSRKASPRGATPTQAPQVTLPWAPDSLQKTKERMSRKLQKRKLGSFDSSWSGLAVRPETRRGATENTDSPFGWQPVEATPIPPVPVRATRRKSAATRTPPTRKRDTKQEGRSKGLSLITNRQAGLPQRRSGAGHGAGILPVDSDNALRRKSWMTTLGSVPLEESGASTKALDAFPSPPFDGKENQVGYSMMNVTKPSLRIVNPSSEHSESLTEWHTKRARDKLEGVARFSNAGSSRSLSNSRVVGSSALSQIRAMSPSIPENDTYASHTDDSTWRYWSGIGPGARAGSSLSGRVPPPLSARNMPRAASQVSSQSTGQFDSAMSSDSLYEEENLIHEVDDDGEREWRTDTESASPRLPFEPGPSSQEGASSTRGGGNSRGARLADQRKRVSLGGDADYLHRSEKSQAASLRYI